MRLAPKNKKKLLAMGSLFVLAILAVIIWSDQAFAPDSENAKNIENNQSNQNNPDGFDKSKYSLTDPSSIWVVVNKKRPLPNGYAPTDIDGDLRREATKKLRGLLAVADKSGHPLYVISGFRSQDSQTLTYNSYVSRDGQAQADTYSARPRHSEHQTGLAVDLGNGTCDLEVCFGTTPAGKWLAAHAHEYGFIIRYQKGKEKLTGYQYEPWHLRYVGAELAKELSRTGQTMEQFFDLPPPAPSY